MKLLVFVNISSLVQATLATENYAELDFAVVV